MFKFFAFIVACGLILCIMTIVTVLFIMFIGGCCLEYFDKHKNKNSKQNDETKRSKSMGIKLEDLWFRFADYPEKLTYSLAHSVKGENIDDKYSTTNTDEMESFIHKYSNHIVEDFAVHKTENGFNLFIYI